MLIPVMPVASVVDAYVEDVFFADAYVAAQAAALQIMLFPENQRSEEPVAFPEIQECR